MCVRRFATAKEMNRMREIWDDRPRPIPQIRIYKRRLVSHIRECYLGKYRAASMMLASAIMVLIVGLGMAIVVAHKYGSVIIIIFTFAAYAYMGKWAIKLEKTAKAKNEGR